MNKKNILIIVIGVVILVAAGLILRATVFKGQDTALLNILSKKNYIKLDDFAKCLTQKSVVMYGAYWCPHCQAQKKLFGSSFKYVNYVECTKDIKKCEGCR